MRQLQQQIYGINIYWNTHISNSYEVKYVYNGLKMYGIYYDVVKYY